MIAKDAKGFGIKVCSSPGGEEQTLVYYDAVEKKLKVDTTRSSLTAGAKIVEAAPIELGAEETAETPSLRGQISRRGICQRSPGGDAAHLSLPSGQRRRGAFRQRRRGQRRDPRNLGDDAFESVLNFKSRIGTVGRRGQVTGSRSP